MSELFQTVYPADTQVLMNQSGYPTSFATAGAKDIFIARVAKERKWAWPISDLSILFSCLFVTRFPHQCTMLNGTGAIKKRMLNAVTEFSILCRGLENTAFGAL